MRIRNRKLPQLRHDTKSEDNQHYLVGQMKITKLDPSYCPLRQTVEQTCTVDHRTNRTVINPIRDIHRLYVSLLFHPTPVIHFSCKFRLIHSNNSHHLNPAYSANCPPHPIGCYLINPPIVVPNRLATVEAPATRRYPAVFK